MTTSVALTALIWCITTAIFSNSSNTLFLEHFSGDVLAHNVSRFSGSVLACFILGYFLGFKSFVIPLGLVPEKLGTLLLPACCMVIMNVSNSLAMSLSGVTLTYVVKSTIPLWTVLWSYSQGERYPSLVAPALLMCVIGVSIASFTDFEVTAGGFAAALLSTWSQTCFNISSKKCIEKANITSTQAFFVSMIFCFFATQVVYRMQFYANEDLQPIFRTAAWDAFMVGEPISLLLITAASMTYFYEYQLNFVYVTQVTPLTFAITDIVRRLGTIVCNSFMFNKELSLLNQGGIGLALGGALWYSFIVASSPSSPKSPSSSSSKKIEHPQPAGAAKKMVKSEKLLPHQRLLMEGGQSPVGVRRSLPKRIPSANWTEPEHKNDENLTPTVVPRKSVPRSLDEQKLCDTLMAYDEDLLPMSPSRKSRYSLSSASSSSTCTPKSPDKAQQLAGGPKLSLGGDEMKNNMNVVNNPYNFDIRGRYPIERVRQPRVA